MNKLYFFTIAVVLVYIAEASVDFCKKELCSNNRVHIKCENNNRFSNACPKDAALVTFTPDLKNLIVDKVNEKRNFIAGGGDRNHKPACRMGTIQWDDELAKLAELNVKQCNMKHDCHNTHTFRLSGQNLAWQSYFNEPNHLEHITKSLEQWFGEVKNSNMNIINQYIKNTNGKKYEYGHFTVLVNDRNIRIGCAASTYSMESSNEKNYLVACNMGSNNIPGYKIYSSCPSAASQCITGKNSKYPNLCSSKEKIDVNSV